MCSLKIFLSCDGKNITFYLFERLRKVCFSCRRFFLFQRGLKRHLNTMYNILEFPIEIQEIILSQLSLHDVFTMSKVCKLWFGICSWIAKEKFSKIIPEECMQEIENLGIPQDEISLTAANFHYLQKCVTNNMLDQTKNVVVELNENRHLCFCIHGPLIFIGCDSGEIDVYNPEENNQPVLQLKIQNSPIFQLDVMTNMNLLLAKTGRNDLAFISLPYFTGKSWVYKMIHLKPNVQNYSGELHSERNFSICGTILVMATDVQQICVFRVTAVKKKTVELNYESNYIADEPIGHVSVWQDEVIVLFKAGEILRWCLTSQVSFLSERYHEIHYENPVWIFRGRIFCSTFISSQLLGYWHMDRGAEYWLVGKPACDLVRCRDLGTMFSADTGVEDVLCVCLKQRLLACGTRNGKILLYYLSDIFFSNDDFNVNGNDHLTREFNRVPDLTIRTTERPLRNIQIQFDENSITIYTWPYMVRNRPELKGLLQCIVLREGGWVEQSDRDGIRA